VTTTTVNHDLGEFEGEGTLVVEAYFAIVPEWVIDADISDAAYRLYSVLLRYGQSSGTRMPSRALLARRLKKRSVDSVDRALKELVAVGAVVVERRRRGRVNLSNRYHLKTTPPGLETTLHAASAVRAVPARGGSVSAARSPAGLSGPVGEGADVPWPHGCGDPGRRTAARPRSSYPGETSRSTPSVSTGRGHGAGPERDWRRGRLWARPAAGQ
jgi:hypothetical protein